MTANLVTGFSPVQDLMPQTSANNGQNSSTDFSDVLKANTSKQTDVSDYKNNDSKSVEMVKAEQNDEKTSDASIISEKDDAAETDMNVSKEEPAEAVKNDDSSNEEPDMEVMEAVAEIVATMIATVAEVLDVSVEDVWQAMDTIGIEREDILDATVIPKLTVELTEHEDVGEIITDEELFADVRQLMETSEKLVNELAKELDIPVDELKTVIASKAEAADNQPKEETVVSLGKEESMDFEPAPQLAYVPNVDIASSKMDSRQDNAGRQDDRRGNDANENANISQSITDNIRESVHQIAEEAPVSYTSATSMEDILEQVSNNLKMTMKDDITEMEMQLHPASLGNIRVQVAARDGVVTANFTTQNEAVRQALETQIVELREQLNEQGIKVEAIEVTVSSHAFERNLSEEGDRGKSQGEAEAKKKRTRGINLGEIDAIDEMDEEDRVTADMMARAGNTVDYLA